MATTIRRARLSDKAELAKLRSSLWPEMKPAENIAELDRFFQGGASTLPAVVLVSQENSGALIGFIEVGLRSHADGCDAARPVGFIEGWFVSESSRKQGIGRQLMRSAEEWARTHGCIEMASDALIDNLTSQRAHQALGFEVVDRCVHLRKSLL